MRRLLLLLSAFVLASSCAHAATLRVKGTAPIHLNDGTCTAPVLTPGTLALVIHAQVVGKGLEDSIATTPGQPFAFSWSIASGTYQVRAWASLAAVPLYAGCDTTIIASAIAPPARVTITP